MTDEMLVAQAQWLPQYAHAIPEAKKRLKREKALGTWTWTGVARKQVNGTEAVAVRNRKTAAKRKAGKQLDIAEPEG
jgi:alpha-galactosidase